MSRVESYGSQISPDRATTRLKRTPTFDVSKAKSLMEKNDIDILVASSPENFRYVSGFFNRTISLTAPRSFTTFALVFREKPQRPSLIIMDSVAELAKRESWVEDQHYYGSWSYAKRPQEIEILAPTAGEALVKTAREKNALEANFGIEEGALSASTFRELKRKLPNAQFKDATFVFKELRCIKSKLEVEKIVKATRVTETALEATLASVKEDITELQVARELELNIVKEGGHLFHILLSAGKRSAMNYIMPSRYRLRKGDILRIDAGAMYEGYVTDFARTAVIGKPSNRLKKVHRVLCNAEQRAIEAIRPGIKVCSIYKIIEETVRKAVYANYLRRPAPLGHGIGIEIAEEPIVIAGNRRLIEEGMVLCIEVPYYVLGWGGLNVEDVVLVTKRGHEVISNLDRRLWVL